MDIANDSDLLDDSDATTLRPTIKQREETTVSGLRGFCHNESEILCAFAGFGGDGLTVDDAWPVGVASGRRGADLAIVAGGDAEAPLAAPV